MNRINKLQTTMSLSDIDQMIITDYFNMLYFVNIKLHVGERLFVLLIDKIGKPKLFINELFPLADNDAYEMIRFSGNDDAIALLASHLHGKKIGIDKSWAAGFLIRLMHFRNSDYVDGSVLIDKLRSIKDIDEQNAMIMASRENDKIMSLITKHFKTGISEKEIAVLLKKYFMQNNHQETSFNAIVAFGENAADPHAVASDRKLKPQDVILIDMGGVYQNYCSDMTRTFFWQDDSKLKDIYDIVKAANLAAISKIKVGVAFSEIDNAAREVITKAGYGPFFTHRCGHGIGLQVHEPYDVAASNHSLIEAGMCFSIEPGIYLPQIGGVRIEDLVLVKEDKVQVLNSFSKDRMILR